MVDAKRGLVILPKVRCAVLGLSLALSAGNPVLAARASYTQRWVQFANSAFANTTGATYLEKSGTFTGSPADATAFSYVVYLQHTDITTIPQHLMWIQFLSTDTVTSYASFQHNAAATSGVSRFRIQGDGGGTVLQRDSVASQITATSGGPIMLMVSCTRGSAAAVYVGDTAIASAGTTPTWSNTEDLYLANMTACRVAAAGDSVRPFTGKLGLVWFDDTDLDFTQESSRRLFWSGSAPVRPPSGALIHLGGEATAATWGTNQGTGGDFTIVNSGGLTDV